MAVCDDNIPTVAATWYSRHAETTVAAIIDANFFAPTSHKDFLEALKQSINTGGVNVIHVTVDTQTNVSTHKTASKKVNEALQ